MSRKDIIVYQVLVLHVKWCVQNVFMTVTLKTEIINIVLIIIMKKLDFTEKLYVMVIGSHPYPGMSSKQVIDEITAGYRLPKPESCSDEM